MDEFQRTYEIHEVAQLTGLAPARLRAWERRYQIIAPVRLPNGYRAYTADQVALLRAYARLIESGHRIGDLAVRPVDEVIAEAEAGSGDASPHGELLEAVKAFDRDRLEGLIAQQLSLRGLRAFSQEIVLPLAQAVGDLWALGKIPIAAEHLASEVVLHALKGGLRMARGNGPLVVASVLSGDRHEWGFLSTLTMVHELGWRIHYLGADLPVDDVQEASWKLRPQAIAISASDPGNLELHLPALLDLPGRLPPGTIAVIGGGGTRPHEAALSGVGFRIGLDAFTLHPDRSVGA